MITRLTHFLTTNRASILAFLTVGSLAAIINIVAFNLIWNFLHFNYEVTVTISFILSVIFHFNANRHFTFKSGDVHFYHQLPKYLSMVLLNYVLTLLVMYVVVSILHLPPYFGNVASIGATVVIGYLMSRYWVFTQATE